MVALLKKIPLGLVEMSAIRERGEQLRDGNFCDYRPVLPLMLASFIFDVLCTPGKHRLLFDIVSFSSAFSMRVAGDVTTFIPPFSRCRVTGAKSSDSGQVASSSQGPY